MIDIEDSPLAPVIMTELGQKIDVLRLRYGMTPTLLKEVRQVIYDIRVKCKHQGIAFPKLVPIILPSVPLVHLVRADLDRKAIEVQVVNLVTMHPQLQMGEIAFAVFEAFPSYRPAVIH